MGSKVSMVMSCYNKEAYVGATLQSMYDQDWDNIEFVLINNGSTDGSLSILRAWEKKLLDKGFEVVLIDQENQGLPAAMLTGMKRMSGEYFCTVDADDEIYPEYVSTMAGFLDGHPDYEWASCDYEHVYNRFSGGEVYAERPDLPNRPDEQPFVENLLLMRNPRVVWRYMIRKSYMERCGVIENFVTEPRMSHEPQILLPLFAGGGRIKHFPEILVKYNQEIGMVLKNTFDRVLKVEGEILSLIKKTLAWMNVPEPQKKRWEIVAETYFLQIQINYSHLLENEPEKIWEIYREAAAFVNASYILPVELTARDINRDPNLFIRTLHYITLFKEEVSLAPFKKGKRIQRFIGYGALGKAAAWCMPLLIGTCFEPHELWDKKAEPGMELWGKPVTRPDFGSLSDSDMLLVFPKNKEVIAEIRHEAEKTGCQILYYEHISRLGRPIMLFPVISMKGHVE